MTDDQPAAPGRPGFVRGNERLDQLLADPQLSADVAAAHADAEEMDRVYAMNLAMIRKAAQMTQVEVARKLGVGQGVVSRLEHRDDMLLSTLYDYLMATGAEGASIVVIVHGHRIELDLSGLRNLPEQQSALAGPSHMPGDAVLERAHVAVYGRGRSLCSLTTFQGHRMPPARNVSWHGALDKPSATGAPAAGTSVFFDHATQPWLAGSSGAASAKRRSAASSSLTGCPGGQSAPWRPLLGSAVPDSSTWSLEPWGQGGSCPRSRASDRSCYLVVCCWLASLYSVSVTGSSQVVPSPPSVPSSMARWHMKLLSVAPCQCSSPGGV